MLFARSNHSFINILKTWICFPRGLGDQSIFPRDSWRRPTRWFERGVVCVFPMRWVITVLPSWYRIWLMRWLYNFKITETCRFNMCVRACTCVPYLRGGSCSLFCICIDEFALLMTNCKPPLGRQVMPTTVWSTFQGSQWVLKASYFFCILEALKMA